jgi:hypothetical protein
MEVASSSTGTGIENYLCILQGDGTSRAGVAEREVKGISTAYFGISVGRQGTGPGMLILH